MITQCPKTGRTCEVTGCAGCWKDSTTQDEIIRMAREAGFEGLLDKAWGIEQLERFAAIVAAHEREKHLNLANEVAWSVALAEREACAKVCEKMAPRTVCAAAIRARGNE